MRAVNLDLKAGKKSEHIPMILDTRKPCEEVKFECFNNKDGKPLQSLRKK